MYEALSNKQYIKMQNIEYRNEEWLAINNLSNKEIKRLKKAKRLKFIKAKFKE
ncbi:hypothetical protein HYE36_05970 [Mycoplasmopsis bovis]|nr:hypothetical protein [Mycoplasmopsis bovis]WHL49569.1 hypothetical protein HYE36_05970 [Mycoplasmopsis bovis]